MPQRRDPPLEESSPQLSTSLKNHSSNSFKKTSSRHRNTIAAAAATAYSPPLSCRQRCQLLINYSAGFRRRHRFLLLFTLAAIITLYLILNPAEFDTKMFFALTNTANARNSNNILHPPVLYGHVHMAKTGGTSLNGILANKFDHVCGHKGYSYDAYRDNERAKNQTGAVVLPGGSNWSRSRVKPDMMQMIGFENCDYITHEVDWFFWRKEFGKGRFHGVNMELHVPCRNRIEHLMSMCNYEEYANGKLKFQKSKIACDAKTDEELFDSVKKCFLYLDRYNHALLEQFDVKCFSFHNQFTNYIDHMSTILSHRRFESNPYVKRETNDVRNKEEECIWYNPMVREKVDKFLLDKIPYYQFCESCMGSENEIAT